MPKNGLETIWNTIADNRFSLFLRKTGRNLFFPLPAPHALNATVLIEISSVCNAKCVFCNYRMGYRSKQLRSLTEVKRIAESCVGKGYHHLNLTSAGGENTLNPEFIEIISAAKEAGFKSVVTYTNGIALHRFDPEKLLLSGIDAIAVSFPGFAPDYFKTIYGVDAFSSFRRSIEGLLTAHKKLGSQVKIAFEPRTTLSNRELCDTEFYRSFIASHLGEHVTILEALRVFDSWSGAIRKTDFPPGMRLATATLKSIPFKKTHLCERMFPLSILCNGNVRFCGCVYDSDVETEKDPLFIANLGRYRDFTELIEQNAGKIRQMRMDFREGKLPSLCRKCTLYKPARSEGLL